MYLSWHDWKTIRQKCFKKLLQLLLAFRMKYMMKCKAEFKEFSYKGFKDYLAYEITIDDIKEISEKLNLDIDSQATLYDFKNMLYELALLMYSTLREDYELLDILEKERDGRE